MHPLYESTLARGTTPTVGVGLTCPTIVSYDLLLLRLSDRHRVRVRADLEYTTECRQILEYNLLTICHKDKHVTFRRKQATGTWFTQKLLKAYFNVPRRGKAIMFLMLNTILFTNNSTAASACSAY